MRDDLRGRLRSQFAWNSVGGADPSRWWLDPQLLRDLAAGLAGLHEEDVDVVAAVPTRGFILGPLVAAVRQAGFVEIRKDRRGDADGKQLLLRSTPPDYQERGLELSLRRGVLAPRDRVLLVDDWIVTGAQITAAARLIEDAGATYVGAAVVVDDTTAAVRRDLMVRSLLSVRELD